MEIEELIKNRKKYRWVTIVFVLIFLSGLVFLYYSGFELDLFTIFILYTFYQTLLIIITVKKTLEVNHLKTIIHASEDRFSLLVSVVLTLVVFGGLILQSVELHLLLSFCIVFTLVVINICLKWNNKVHITNSGLYLLPDLTKVIDPKDVTDIRFEDAKISIDTTKYLNHFWFSKSKLKSPEWNTVKEQLEEIKKIWCVPDTPQQVDN